MINTQPKAIRKRRALSCDFKIGDRISNRREAVPSIRRSNRNGMQPVEGAGDLGIEDGER